MENAIGWRATEGSSNPVELIQAFRQAITEEIIHIKTKGSDVKLELKNGEFINKSLEYSIYRFPLASGIKINDDTPINIYIGNQRTDGFIVTSGEDYVDISVVEDYGPVIHHMKIKSDSSALLDILLSRYDDILSGASKFDATGPMKLFGFTEPGNNLPCGIGVSDSSGLNVDQKMAVAKALSREVTFVWGPPGTGKTKTLSVILNHLIRAKKTVLLISHTNLALDEVIKKFAEDPENKSLIEDGRVIRYGNPSNTDPVIKSFLIDNVNDRKIGEAYQRIDGLNQEIRAYDQQITSDMIILESPDYKLLTSCVEELTETTDRATVLKEKITAIKLQLVDRYREKNKLESNAIESNTGSGKKLIKLLGNIVSAPSGNALPNVLLQIEQLKASENALANEVEQAENRSAELKSKITQLKEHIAYSSSLESDRDLDLINTRIEGLKLKISHLQADIFETKKEIVKYENLIFGNALVVGCTLTKCYADRNIQDCKFDVMILDEASMANMPAVFFAAGRASQYVISGDFRQLSPIAMSSGPLAAKWLKRDIFAQAGIVESINEGRGDDRLVMLKEQYRMHPKIAGIINGKMYAGQLKTNRRTETDRDQIAALPPCEGHAVVLCDTSNVNPWCTYAGSSKINLYSAMLSAKMAETAILGGIKSVGIITPYKKQVKIIERLLEEQNIDRKIVSVTTIHKAQGNEKDCIIIDLVEGPPGNIGRQFIASSLDSDSARLINVAISRAKGKLIIISNNQYFKARLKPGNILHDLLKEINNTGQLVDSKGILSSYPAVSKQTTIGGIAEISADSKQLIYDATEFYRAFIVDVDNATSRIAIFSPFITNKRMAMLINPLKAAAARGVNVFLIIRSLKEDNTKAEKEQLIEEIKSHGIHVIIASESFGISKSFHEKIALIDKTVFYFGSLNILSQSGTSGASDYMFAFSNARTIEDLVKYFRIDVILGRHKRPKGQQLNLPMKSFDDQMADAQFGAAMIHIRQQKYQEAAEDLKKAIDLYPFKSDYHYYLSEALLHMDDKTGAQKEIDKAIVLSPENEEYRSFKATLDLA